MKLRFACVLAFALLGACKQGQGDRCQVDDDCRDDLICSGATQTCQLNENALPLDATVPDAPLVDANPDAQRPDAAPDAPDAPPDAEPDAAVDAMVDAMIDAT